MSFRNAFVLLLASVGAQAATITVGPSGDEATIQAAVDLAITSVENDEIRVAAGIFTERLNVQPVNGDAITISGGWNPGFDGQSGMTTLDAMAIDGVVDLYAAGTNEVHFSRIQFTNGLAPRGGGLEITLFDSAVVTLTDCAVVNNVADGDRVDGGGITASLSDSSSLTLLRTDVSNNASNCSGTVDCREGGLGIGANGSASVTIRDSTITNNSVAIADGSGFSGGLGINAFDAGTTVVLENNRIEGNSVQATSGAGLATGLTVLAAGTVTLSRNIIVDNQGLTGNPTIFSQAVLSLFGTQTARVSDSLVADSATRGLSLFMSGDGPTLYATNLTLANHGGAGVRISDNSTSGMAFLSNTIAVDNNDPPSLSPGVVETTNLYSGTGLFMDAPAGDYRLAEGAAAIDVGTDAPPGGLSMLDLDAAARIAGAHVDIGAYEFVSDVLFRSGFEVLIR